jgi:CubicO group peptidase (beta-lactamase class C family)
VVPFKQQSHWQSPDLNDVLKSARMIKIEHETILSDGSDRGTELNERKLQTARKILKIGSAKNAFAGSVALVARHGRVALHAADGFAVLFPRRERTRLDTVFDLASVTKPVATATSIMILVEQQKLELNQRIAEILPGFSKTRKRNIRIKHLLCHTSGLPAWSDFYTRHTNQRSIIHEISRSIELTSEPGTKATYSDLGFMVLGAIVEQVGGYSLDRFSKENIFKPLGMRDTCFKPSFDAHRTAATEFSNWRFQFVRGKVHDENAAAAKGVSGHAGLFSTARDLGVFCQMMLNGGIYKGTRILLEKAVKQMTRNQTLELGSYFGLGWWMKTSETPNVGERISHDAFGHNGYTGTSIWMDPKYDLSIVLLTNRIHPVREGKPCSDESVGIMMDRRASWSSVQQQFHNSVISATQ